jgi:HNH endonuclease
MNAVIQIQGMVEMVAIIDLSEPQNHRCCYCGHRMIRCKPAPGEVVPRNAATRDHVEPRSYGGVTSWWNLVAACSQCNSLRGQIEAVAFYNLMQKWFKRDPSLRTRWYELSKDELRILREECTNVHTRQLGGLARRSIEFAFRHYDFALGGRYRFPRKRA